MNTGPPNTLSREERTGWLPSTWIFVAAGTCSDSKCLRAANPCRTRKPLIRAWSRITNGTLDSQRRLRSWAAVTLPMVACKVKDGHSPRWGQSRRKPKKEREGRNQDGDIPKPWQYTALLVSSVALCIPLIRMLENKDLFARHNETQLLPFSWLQPIETWGF